jgi:hypothetical protein
MIATVDAYYDFRSPYAYFANHRIRDGSFTLPPSAAWQWRPVSIDILLNLQAGRDAWAPMSIRSLCRSARISSRTFAGMPRFTERRCVHRSRRDRIRFPLFASLPCLIRKATTASGMRCSTRCGKTSAILRIRAYWQLASFVQAEIQVWSILHFHRKPEQP